jgi:hypothetical protein
MYLIQVMLTYRLQVIATADFWYLVNGKAYELIGKRKQLLLGFRSLGRLMGWPRPQRG